ncbi:hypothetical protein JZ751_011090 [Albula glossodonta]|uniref:receptor protein-tyrosine kinase n=1 Tax=Albula glossodonta TaxID=121402 RepID=A0A8T2NYF1_9TELE|nr:hypothetical protein JZ751_011090 [Albula glossodonta]
MGPTESERFGRINLQITVHFCTLMGCLIAAEHDGTLHGMLSGQHAKSVQAIGLPPTVVPGLIPTELPITTQQAPKTYLNREFIQTLHFKPTVGWIHLSEDTAVKFNCSIDIPDVSLELNIVWWKDGEELAGNLQAIQELLTVEQGVVTLLSTVSIKKVQRADAGEYHCSLSVSDMVKSQPIHIQPEDVNVTENTPFNLSCVAVGPPDPVRIVWLRNGMREGSLNPTPYITIPGVDRPTHFSCEANNDRGVSTSREARINVKGLPSKVSGVTVVSEASNNIVLNWTPGHDGFSPLTTCHVQVKEVEPRKDETTRVIDVSVPPFQWDIPNLRAMTQYNISVSCSNEIGPSPFSPWVQASTTEGVPSMPPHNLTVRLNDSVLVVKWDGPPTEKMNGVLKGYEVIIRQGKHTSKIRSNTNVAHIPVQVFNMTYTIQVAACTQTGTGKLSQEMALFVPEANPALSPSSSPDTRGSDSMYIVFGVVCGFCLLLLVLWMAMQVFGSREEINPVVQYKAQRSYNRSAIEVTREFGSVVEGYLKKPDGVTEKVAVKTMKLDNFSQREIEEFLNEAACMKDFHHPNVIRLLGVCLEVGSSHFPKPMVILPFMKYGDLHSFLLRSRLGDSPLVTCGSLPISVNPHQLQSMSVCQSSMCTHQPLNVVQVYLSSQMYGKTSEMDTPRKQGYHYIPVTLFLNKLLLFCTYQ